MSASSNLLSLPEEIILKILAEGDYRAILACKCTCRRIHHIISGSISLRYSVELAANGMQHGSCFSLGKIQCLEMLAAYEAAWRTLSWSDNASVDMLVGWGPPISVSGNVIGFGSKPDVPRKELLLLRTPSKLRNVTMKSWRLQLPYDVHDVCMDSSQDLLIYYTGVKSFHVCSLLSGGTHPLAQHIGVFNATSSWRYRVGSMRICGDNFAVASEQGLYISVWNWKSGEHISDFTASLQSSVFTFLDNYRILFPSLIDDSLYVYDIRAMPPINLKKQKLKGTHCFEISIHRSGARQTLCSINLTCNSLPTGVDTASGLFRVDPHDRMISLQLIVGSNPTGTHPNLNGAQDYHDIHVHAHSLLMWTQAHPAPPNACVVVPWSAWGPAAARVVAPQVDDSDVLFMCPSQSRFPGCGMRIVSPPSMRSDGMSVVTVTDYHPARVFRGRNQNKVLHHTDNPSMHVGIESRHKAMIPSAERGNQDGMYSRVRSKSLPLPTFFGTPSIRAMSTMEVIKNLILYRWRGPPQELERTRAPCVPRTRAKKIQYLERDILLPKELWLNTSQPVFNVLCEDAVMFYTLLPESTRSNTLIGTRFEFQGNFKTIP
ncbi:hypothetical protein BJV74DRAFT_798906 [Russula compacta]|nr:hypothetical protein BJV74DRAFT_798906 [Russula compacta]